MPILNYHMNTGGSKYPEVKELRWKMTFLWGTSKSVVNIKETQYFELSDESRRGKIIRRYWTYWLEDDCKQFQMNKIALFLSVYDRETLYSIWVLL